MDQKRLDLQVILEMLLGTTNVYFQPPATLAMEYPCIVYQRDSGITKFAANVPYSHTKRYQVTHISRTSDSDVQDKIALLPQTLRVRFFTAAGLNHDVFEIYF